MMTQNRHAARDRDAAAHDYEVDPRAERDMGRLHDKMDALREAQWAEPVRMQQEQIRLLERLLARQSARPCDG